MLQQQPSRPAQSHAPTPAAAAAFARHTLPGAAKDVHDWESYGARQRALSVDLLLAHLPTMDARSTARARATLALLAEQLQEDADRLAKRIDAQQAYIDAAPPEMRGAISMQGRQLNDVHDEVQTALLYARLGSTANAQ